MRSAPGRPSMLRAKPWNMHWQNPSGFATKRSKVCAPLYAASETPPSRKNAKAKRRCLIPADGFFEWKKVPSGKIPYLIGMKDDSPFVFAGLWEGWKDPENGEWSHPCTIITGKPNEFVREIHTRMPVILPEEHHDSWLSGEGGKEILVPFPANQMKAWPISSRVNSPKNNDAEIIVPVELQSVSPSENSPGTG